MRSTIASSAMIAAALVTALASLAPVTASAREGARSVGGGIKCYTAAIAQPDGTVSYQQICYKGI